MKVILGPLRVLQSEEQEVEATCKPVDSTVPDADEQNGISKQYDCSAEANGEGTISNVAFDDSKKVRTVTNGETKSYGGDEIFFGEELNLVKINNRISSSSCWIFYFEKWSSWKYKSKLWTI